MSYTPTPEEVKVISIMKAEKATWEEGNVFVTPKVSFVMRNVINKARKNYYSIFDNEKDPITGRDNLFIPLTEWTVEDTLKEEDIDTKDITVKLSLIHISEPTRRLRGSRMPSSA